MNGEHRGMIARIGLAKTVLAGALALSLSGCISLGGGKAPPTPIEVIAITRSYNLLSFGLSRPDSYLDPYKNKTEY